MLYENNNSTSTLKSDYKENKFHSQDCNANIIFILYKVLRLDCSSLKVPHIITPKTAN